MQAMTDQKRNPLVDPHVGDSVIARISGDDIVRTVRGRKNKAEVVHDRRRAGGAGGERKKPNGGIA